MRVVLLARSLETGGMQRQLVELAKRLTAAGELVEVVLFYGGNSVLEEEVRAAHVPLTVIGKRGRWDVLRFLVRMALHVRRARADVVYSLLTVPNVVAAVLRPLWRRSRIVWGVRDSDADLRMYTRALRVSHLLARLLARRADVIIFNSFAGRSHYVAAGYPAHRSIVVPNGIDTERFQRDEHARHELRLAWGARDGQPLIGVVARVDPMKGHGTFLEAAAVLHARRPELRFVCVGSGAQERMVDLEARAGMLGLASVLHWAGELSDVVGAYSALDVLCLPSWSGEGFPNVVGEAMSCGLPVVVTDVGDAALVAGPAGRAVPPRDAPALAAAIERVLQEQAADPAATALASRLRVRSHYDARLLATRSVAAFSGREPVDVPLGG